MGVKFPQHLNAPVQVLWMEADTAAIFAGTFTFACTVGGWALYLSSLLLTWGYSHVKRNYTRGLLKHSIYFLGLGGFKGYPGFFEKRFRE